MSEIPRLIRRSRLAMTDVEEISTCIARDDPSAAVRLVDRFSATFNLLVAYPRSGQDVSRLAEGVRSLLVGSYLIYYRAVPDGIEVVRVLHGACNISTGFFGE